MKAHQAFVTSLGICVEWLLGKEVAGQQHDIQTDMSGRAGVAHLCRVEESCVCYCFRDESKLAENSRGMQQVLIAGVGFHKVTAGNGHENNSLSSAATLRGSNVQRKRGQIGEYTGRERLGPWAFSRPAHTCW